MRGIVATTATVILAMLAGVQLGRWSRGAPATTSAQSRASSAAKTSSDPTALTGAPLPSDPAYVTAQAATVTPRLEAYGEVQPISTLPVNAAEEGIVAGLTIAPGMHVRAGQQLAHLNGPAIQLTLQQSEADVRSTQAQLTAAQKSLAIEQKQLPSHLSTRATVEQAESAVAQAQASFDNAQSHLQAVRQMMTISAPANGTVLAINASDGQLVSVGQSVVTLQTRARLWLQASYYGAASSSIRVGMIGISSRALKWCTEGPWAVRARSNPTAFRNV